VNISKSSVGSLGSSIDHVDSSKFEEFVIQRSDIVKSDLQQRVEKEVRGNAIL